MLDLKIFGDSHAVAIGHGLTALKEKGEPLPVKISVAKIFGAPQANRLFHEVDGDRIAITGDAGSEFTKLMGRNCLDRDDRDTAFVCSIGYTTTKFFRHEMWAEYTPVPGRQGKQFVSEGVTGAMFIAYNQHSLDFYRQMKRLGLRCASVVTPPPQPGDPATAEGIAADEILRIDQVCRKAYEAELTKIGIPSIAPPETVYTACGFLNPIYSSERVSDFHHGNQQYGEIMLRTIIDDTVKRYNGT